MIRVVSLNCNGVRSAARKGLYAWLNAIEPDVICLQETKAQEHQFPLDAAPLHEYFAVYADAEKKGYSGVAIYSKKRPDAAEAGFGWPEYDREGRYVQVNFGNLSIGSVYVPSGTMGIERQRWKDRFLERFEMWLADRICEGRQYILCGDFNIAHRSIDVYNPKSAVRITGFLTHERAWIDAVFATLGWVDVQRVVAPETPGIYTWWSNFQNRFETNHGWRIDYHLVTPGLRDRVRSAYVYREERFSDHAPVVVEYDLEL